MLERLLDLPQNHSFFLLGPRKTGKSTLLFGKFPKETSLVYDLLDLDQYKYLKPHPELFQKEVLQRSSQITHVIIDEVQKIPALLDAVQYIMGKPNPPFFCMSGSSARKLRGGHANLLAGRAWMYHLHPLTHLELGGQFSLNKALERGTLPNAYLALSDQDAQMELKSYVDAYIKEEIRAEALTRNLEGFLRFLDFAAHESGNIVNFSAMSREVGVSHATVKEYFQVLEDTLMGFLLFAYAGSVRKRLVKHPKFYFFDTGVTRALQNQLSVRLTPGNAAYGRLFEQFVILELMRLNSYRRRDLKFSFYRSSNGAEVDLIVETPEKETLAIEIKSSQYPEKEGFGGLRSFKEICPLARLYCVAPIVNQREWGECRILPWQEMARALALV